MPKSFRRMASKVGMPPGSLVYTGEKELRPPKSPSLVTTNNYRGTPVETFTDCQVVSDPGEVTWINVSGISRVKDLEKLGECFKIHPLVLEDILEVGQRPKVEDYDDYLYIVFNSIRPVSRG